MAFQKLKLTVVFFLVSGSGSWAHAAAPMVKKGGPGYYRMMLGDFEVTALSDGTVTLPVNKILQKITEAQVDRALAAQSLVGPLDTSVIAYLINTGAVKLFGPTLGNLLDNLKACGYTPEQVDEVYVTHMHADHVGGLMNGSARAFPNAIVRADKADADFWLSKENLDKAPEAMKGFFQGAQASLNPYLSAGKFMPYDDSTELQPGLRAVVTRGHTSGHSVFAIESNGQKMLVLGDLMHVAAVQFANPEVTIQFDSDAPTAAAERRAALYTEGARDQYIFAVAHISFPGLGRLAPNGTGGFVWLPVNYSPMK